MYKRKRGTTRRKCRWCKQARVLNNLQSRICSMCQPAWREWVAQKKMNQEARQASYNLIVEERDGETCCEICGRYSDKRRLNVDHNHKTGKIRGILCYFCNYGLRWFKDNPKRLERAALYLRNTENDVPRSIWSMAEHVYSLD